jgi:hypothetical protein
MFSPFATLGHLRRHEREPHLVGADDLRTVIGVSDGGGAYRLLNVDAGSYRIEIVLPGFRTETREVELLARQTLRVDVQLAPAGTQEAVNVVAQASVIETDRATVDSSR